MKLFASIAFSRFHGASSNSQPREPIFAVNCADRGGLRKRARLCPMARF